jgi:hypothetical protein
MPHFVGFWLVLAILAAPLSAGAQIGEEPRQPPPQEPALELRPDQPELQLKVDDAGVGVVQPPPRTPDGYTLEEIEARIKRAKIGLGVSAGIYALAMGLAIGGIACANNAPTDDFISVVPGRCYGLYLSGGFIGMGGLIGMIISGVRLAKNKRNRDWLRRAQYGRRQPIQWSLARSERVF